MQTAPKIKLIVGLGNPGQQYEKTRHNTGFWLGYALAEKYNTTFKHETKFHGLVSTLAHSCKLLLPTTFMNLSGIAVRSISNFYKIPIASILVIHDEIDFAPGIIRLKKNGGANGHNGVQNIIEHLGDNDFWRLRIGIGKPARKEEVVNYVLHTPSLLEGKNIHAAIAQATTIIPELFLGDFAQAMQILHS